MATFIETNDVAIFIDPAVSLAPRRFSLPPHELEWRRLEEVASEIERRALESDIIVVTHYHYDHHDPGKHVSLEIYNGKLVIIKDPRNNINISQRIRASKFIKLIRDRVRKLIIADGSTLSIGGTTIKFSNPVPHGSNTRLGYVVEVLIKDDDIKFLFSSDVEGPVNSDAADFIIDSQPDLMIIDGPPTYLLGSKFDESSLRKSLDNLTRIASLSNATVIIDHHLLRDLNYSELYERILRHGAKARVMTAAEYMGLKPMLLEARRRELYSGGRRERV